MYWFWGLKHWHKNERVSISYKFRLPLVNFISGSRFSIKDCGQPPSIKCSFFLKFELFSSKIVSEEFFRRILKASPLTNLFLTFGGWSEMCVFKKVSVCAFVLQPFLKMQSQCQNVPAVNSIVGWCKFACEGFDVWFTYVP